MTKGAASSLVGTIELKQHGRLRLQNTGRSKARPAVKTSRLASNLLRSTQGSQSAVFKKISSGGAHSAKGLRGQLDYLFSKAEDVFGNQVEHGDGKSPFLSGKQREAIAEDWKTEWRGTPKQGHTSHLLLSFPDHVSPKKAKAIAEVWAEEMFTSGEHAQDEWSYIAALHTDRLNPHVHFVVNNRGIHDDRWFYMAKDHDFNIQMMKERFVDIAEDYGVYLDTSSRVERGILSYGPKRDEVDLAKDQGRVAAGKPLVGEALKAAKQHMKETADAYAGLSVTVEDETLKADLLSRSKTLNDGGVIERKAVELINTLESDDVKSDKAYMSWALKMTDNLNFYSGEDLDKNLKTWNPIFKKVANTLGDYRGAVMVDEQPSTAIYLGNKETNKSTFNEGFMDRIRGVIRHQANDAGLNGAIVAARYSKGAFSAYQERLWILGDIASVAQHRGLDMEDDDQLKEAAVIVDGIYIEVAESIAEIKAVQETVDLPRLKRTFDDLVQVYEKNRVVHFGSSDHAEVFVEDLKARYGDNVIEEIAKGNTEPLSIDLPEIEDQLKTARAIVALAETHEELGIPLSRVDEYRRIYDLRISVEVQVLDDDDAFEL